MYVLEQEVCVLIFLDYVTKFKFSYVYLKELGGKKDRTKYLKILYPSEVPS